MLRSKSPDLVLQEIWGQLCCHYAIRTLMTQAAHHGGHDPDRVSFTATLRIVRQSVAQQGAFPPDHPDAAHAQRQAVLRRILDRLDPARRPDQHPASSNAFSGRSAATGTSLSL